MSAESDAFEVLGIGPTESKDEVRRAFRSSMRKLHPDNGGGADGEAIAALVDARDLLTDAERPRSSGTCLHEWPYRQPPRAGARAGVRRIPLLFAVAVALLSIVVVVFTIIAFAESG